MNPNRSPDDPTAMPLDGAVDRTLDELLVLRCRAGDAAALAALYERWRDRLVAHAAQLLGGRLADAEDVCQDAWLGIARGIRELAEPRSFRAWAYSIATRRAADRLRTLRRTERTEARFRRETVNREGAAGDRDDERDALRRALDTLSGDDRALLRLFYLDELTVAETAEALGVPSGTVKSRLFSARRRLRRALQRSDR